MTVVKIARNVLAGPYFQDQLVLMQDTIDLCYCCIHKFLLLSLISLTIPLLQLPGDNIYMAETGRYRIQWGICLCGLCYYNQRLFTVECGIADRRLTSRLCMYQVTGQGLTLLDTVGVKKFSIYPRVDSRSQQVYMACNGSPGVSVVSWEGNRLTRERVLECVGVCYSVGVMSPDTLCACDRNSRSVSVVRATDDTVTATLRKPGEVMFEKPGFAAVLGDSVLVLYGGPQLVLYENGVSSPGTMLEWPEGLLEFRSMSSDGASKFFVCESEAVFILDVKRMLCNVVNINNDHAIDCTVVDETLWVGCVDGDVVIMSPQ